MKEEPEVFSAGTRLAAAVFLLLAAAAGLTSVSAQNHAAAAPSAPAKLSAEQWQADVRFLGEELPKRHRNAFHRVGREDFVRAVRELHDRIPQMSEDEILVGMMKIVALVRDGHTSLVPREYFRSGGVYPVGFYLFSDGLFVRKAAPEYGEAVGARVLRIGAVSAEEAFRRVSQAAFADNEMGVKNLTPLMLSVPEILAGFQVNEDKQRLSLTVETAGGRQKTLQLRPAGSLGDLFNPPANWVDAAGKSAAPLYLKDARNNFWFEYLKDRKLVYVQQNAVANKEGGETVADFYRRVFDFVEANPVEKLVLDLRNNGGGNNGLNRAVVVGLIKSKVNRRGRLFVVTGRQTFSAAQNLVNQLENYTEAIFVGEPTAGHPNHYGDNRPFQLPNSKLTVRASTVWWQDVDPRDNRKWTAPEIAAEISSEEYRLGQDPALRAVLEYTPGSVLSEMIGAAMGGADAPLGDFISKYRALKASPKSRYADTEAALNRFGYYLLNGRRVADALEIFKLNVEAYPGSANVYDSLGDAYQAAGKKEEAIRSYEKALSISPDYPSSLEALRKLKGQ